MQSVLIHGKSCVDPQLILSQLIVSHIYQIGPSLNIMFAGLTRAHVTLIHGQGDGAVNSTLLFHILS